MTKRTIALIPLLVLTTLLVACGGTRSIDLEDPTAPPHLDVEEGALVTVIMRDGQRHEGRVVAVTADSLTVSHTQYRDGIEATVALAEIATVEVKEGSVFTWIILGLGVLTAAFFIILMSIDWPSMA